MLESSDSDWEIGPSSTISSSSNRKSNVQSDIVSSDYEESNEADLSRSDKTGFNNTSNNNTMTDSSSAVKQRRLRSYVSRRNKRRKKSSPVVINEICSDALMLDNLLLPPMREITIGDIKEDGDQFEFLVWDPPIEQMAESLMKWELDSNDADDNESDFDTQECCQRPRNLKFTLDSDSSISNDSVVQSSRVLKYVSERESKEKERVDETLFPCPLSALNPNAVVFTSAYQQTPIVCSESESEVSMSVQSSHCHVDYRTAMSDENNEQLKYVIRTLSTFLEGDSNSRKENFDTWQDHDVSSLDDGSSDEFDLSHEYTVENIEVNLEEATAEMSCDHPWLWNSFNSYWSPVATHSERDDDDDWPIENIIHSKSENTSHSNSNESNSRHDLSTSEHKDFNSLPENVKLLLLQANPWNGDKSAHEHFISKLATEFPEDLIHHVREFDVKLFSSDFIYRLISCQTSTAVKTLIESLFPLSRPINDKHLFKKSYMNHLILIIQYLLYKTIPPEDLNKSASLHSSENEVHSTTSFSEGNSDVSYDHLNPTRPPLSPIGSWMHRKNNVTPENQSSESEIHPESSQQSLYQLFPPKTPLVFHPENENTMESISSAESESSVDEESIFPTKSPIPKVREWIAKSNFIPRPVATTRSTRVISVPVYNRWHQSRRKFYPNRTRGFSYRNGNLASTPYPRQESYFRDRFSQYYYTVSEPRLPTCDRSRHWNKREYPDYYSYMYDNIPMEYFRNIYQRYWLSPWLYPTYEFPRPRPCRAQPVPSERSDHDLLYNARSISNVHEDRAVQTDATTDFSNSVYDEDHESLPPSTAITNGTESLKRTDSFSKELLQKDDDPGAKNGCSIDVRTRSPSVRNPSSKATDDTEQSSPFKMENNQVVSVWNSRRDYRTLMSKENAQKIPDQFKVMDNSKKRDTTLTPESLFNCLFKTSVYQPSRLHSEEKSSLYLPAPPLPQIANTISFSGALKGGRKKPPSPTVQSPVKQANLSPFKVVKNSNPIKSSWAPSYRHMVCKSVKPEIVLKKKSQEVSPKVILPDYDSEFPLSFNTDDVSEKSVAKSKNKRTNGAKKEKSQVAPVLKKILTREMVTPTQSDVQDSAPAIPDSEEIVPLILDIKPVETSEVKKCGSSFEKSFEGVDTNMKATVTKVGNQGENLASEGKGEGDFKKPEVVKSKFSDDGGKNKGTSRVSEVKVSTSPSKQEKPTVTLQKSETVSPQKSFPSRSRKSVKHNANKKGSRAKQQKPQQKLMESASICTTWPINFIKMEQVMMNKLSKDGVFIIKNDSIVFVKPETKAVLRSYANSLPPDEYMEKKPDRENKQNDELPLPPLKESKLDSVEQQPPTQSDGASNISHTDYVETSQEPLSKQNGGDECCACEMEMVKNIIENHLCSSTPQQHQQYGVGYEKIIVLRTCTVVEKEDEPVNEKNNSSKSLDSKKCNQTPAADSPSDDNAEQTIEGVKFENSQDYCCDVSEPIKRNVLTARIIEAPRIQYNDATQGIPRDRWKFIQDPEERVLIFGRNSVAYSRFKVAATMEEAFRAKNPNEVYKILRDSPAESNVTSYILSSFSKIGNN